VTKKMAEALTEYLPQAGLRVRYLHSDVDTLERIEISAKTTRPAPRRIDVLVCHLFARGARHPGMPLWPCSRAPTRKA